MSSRYSYFWKRPFESSMERALSMPYGEGVFTQWGIDALEKYLILQVERGEISNLIPDFFQYFQDIRSALLNNDVAGMNRLRNRVVRFLTANSVLSSSQWRFNRDFMLCLFYAFFYRIYHSPEPLHFSMVWAFIRQWAVIMKEPNSRLTSPPLMMAGLPTDFDWQFENFRESNAALKNENDPDLVWLYDHLNNLISMQETARFQLIEVMLKRSQLLDALFKQKGLYEQTLWE